VTCPATAGSKQRRKEMISYKKRKIGGLLDKWLGGYIEEQRKEQNNLTLQKLLLKLTWENLCHLERVVDLYKTNRLT
jgi:hypothetical protein